MTPCKFSSVQTANRNLRNAFSLYPTGIAVVTALDGDGNLVAMTINSFTSVSLEPAMISWCIDIHSKSLEVFKNCAEFCISILADNQEDISRNFAKKNHEKFEFFGQRKFERPPSIPLSCAVFRCLHQQSVLLGDHFMLVGVITHYHVNNKSPLVFAKGQYQKLLAHNSSINRINALKSV